MLLKKKINKKKIKKNKQLGSGLNPLELPVLYVIYRYISLLDPGAPFEPASPTEADGRLCSLQSQ